MHLNIILLLNMGLAAGKMEPFIVGGNYTDIKRFPHSVYLYVDCLTIFLCGGSILTNQIVLTAGHCLNECKKEHHNKIKIKFGDSSIFRMKTLLASDFLVHHEYDDDRLQNDIALLYTRTPLPLGEFLKRVAILSRYPTRATGGYVAGWGVINTKSETATSLKYIYQELQNHKMCEDVLAIPHGTFCALSKMKKQHPDQGDSGGALVVYKFVQIGIVSFKNIDHDLVAYTNVTYFHSWIKHNSIKLSCDNVF